MDINICIYIRIHIITGSNSCLLFEFNNIFLFYCESVAIEHSKDKDNNKAQFLRSVLLFIVTGSTFEKIKQLYENLTHFENQNNKLCNKMNKQTRNKEL